MRKLVIVGLWAAMASPAFAAPAPKAPIALAKTSKWEINYIEDSCHLLARFGEGPQSAILKMTRYQPGDAFDLNIYGEPFKYGSSTMTVHIAYGDAPAEKREAMIGRAGNKLPLLILTGQRLDSWVSLPEVTPPSITPAQEQQVKFIDLAIAGGKRFRLETGSLGAPMAAMRTCVNDLVKSWGYDPLQQAQLSRPVTPTNYPGSWLVPGDYPLDSLRNGHNGLVQFRLDVDPSGAVAGCFVLHRTNPDDFADLTCKLLAKRAKFLPALDKDGKPVRSFYISKARFVIPD
jgi:TonB family protein